MPALNQIELDGIKKQQIEDFNAKIDLAQSAGTIGAKYAERAKSDFNNALNPGFLSRMGRAFISPLFAPFRTEFAKTIGKGIGEMMSAGGGPFLAAAAVATISVVGAVVASGGIIAPALAGVLVGAAVVKGLYNMYQTAVNGADYHPLAGRTQENKEMSAALRSSTAENTAELVSNNYAKVGNDILAGYAAKTTQDNGKNLKVTAPAPPPVVVRPGDQNHNPGKITAPTPGNTVSAGNAHNDKEGWYRKPPSPPTSTPKPGNTEAITNKPTTPRLT